MPLLFLALIYCVVEGYILFWAADHIGFFRVLLILGGAALLGVYLVRSQGMSAFARANQAMYRGESPRTELLDGVVLLLCGVVLIIPGLLSDILVLPLLVPPLRRAVAHRMQMRMANQRPGFPGAGFGGFNTPGARGGTPGHHPAGPDGHDNQENDPTVGGGRNFYASRQGPFVFYRFFMSGHPGPGQYPGQFPGKTPDPDKNEFGKSDEYKVIVHEDDQVIDVTSENPDAAENNGDDNSKPVN